MAEGDGRQRFDPKGIAQLALIGAAVALAVYFARAPADVSDADSIAAATGVKPTVDVVRPSIASAPREVATTGVVATLGTVGIRSQVIGEVVWVSDVLRNGSAFAAGQPLLRIDPQDFEIRLRAAKAQLRMFQADLTRKQLQGEARSSKFRRDNPGVDVPPLVARVPQIAERQAEVDRAAELVKKAELDLRRTTIALPFDGWIVNTDTQVGQVVRQALPLGQAIAKNALQVEARVSQSDLDALAPAIGRAAKVRAGKRVFDAEVRRVSAVVDPRSRQATLFLAFDETADSASLPRPGTFAQVSLKGPSVDGVFVLPEAAEQEGGRVWVVDGGTLRAFAPRGLGRTSDGWLVEAFDAKEGVVLGRVPKARSGLPVDAVATPPR